MRCAYIVVIAVSVYTGATYVGKTLEEKNKVLQTEEIARMNSTCPTLLSISRTPRDTLLVMRSEKICITYVMSTLK